MVQDFGAFSRGVANPLPLDCEMELVYCAIADLCFVHSVNKVGKGALGGQVGKERAFSLSAGRSALGWRALLLFALMCLPTTRTSADSGSGTCEEGSLGIIVESLPSLQASGRGGFGKPPNLLATQRALFLAELYGLRINRDKAREFVAYALAAPVPDEEPSMAESGSQEHKKVESKDTTTNMMMFRSVDDLFAAVLCSQSLGLEQHLPDTPVIMAFLLSLFDEVTGLFAKTPAAAGDVRSSAVAMQVAEWFGEDLPQTCTQLARKHEPAQHA